MKTGPLVAAVSLASAALAAGAVVAVEQARAPGGSAPARVGAPDPGAEDLRRRIGALEARVDELAASLSTAREEAAAAREATLKEAESLRATVAKERERADAAATLMAGYSGDPEAGPPKEPPMDAFAKEVSSAMRKGMAEEFRRISELITDPTPEALDLRRKQLKLFASAIGVQAGLDQAQIATLERVLGGTEFRAREELRPLLVGRDDYKILDYPGIRKVSDNAFVAQDAEFDKEFPKDKADRLKRQLDPVRKLFGAMLDELDREAKADAEAPKE